MTNYDVDYFIQKFSNIDENLFTTGYVLEKIKSPDGIETERRCALGYCGVEDNEDCNNYLLTEEAKALIKLFGGVSENHWQVVTNVNDGLSQEIEASGFTPKERLLRKLQSLKE